jgi:KDO2-lipid IV(A) lauroyltransferase
MKPPTAEDRLEYAGVVLFVKIARLVGPRAALGFARFLGRVAFDVIRCRRRVTRSNICRHLSGLTAAEVRAIGRRSYMHLGMGLVEFARLPLVDHDYIRRNIHVGGLEHLDDAIRRGNGGILITGHFGSWELMGCVLARLGYPVKFVVGIQRNPLVQDLMNRLRRASGIGIIEPDSIMEMVRHLRNNGFIAMLSDQDAGGRGVFVDFLGAKASTPQGAARLALITASPIIPGFIVRIGGTKHTVEITEPVTADRGQDKDKAVRQATQEYTRVIERYVRRYPDHWLWAHRRWKTRPG